MLKLTEIKKDYKVANESVHALKGVNLDFRKSEFVCILGQSGCGKTTLLNIIGGLDHYTSGDLVIQGKSTKDFSDRDWDVYRNHRIGFIFQSYNLIPHQTVLGNVELALTIAGVSREERRKRAEEALARVGLSEQLNKKPNQLSGGQMQRVAIARALVNNPDILLADEPTGALDSQTSVEVMELIKEIAAERLVIMVTHNPELAQIYASRIVRLKDGLVESDSNPYDGAEEAEEAVKEPQVETEETQAETAEEAGKPKKKKLRARMSFFTSLALSAKNLLSKKGRTIITSIAGSIGIISVCLVLALSSGFNNYIKRTEEDMLSFYPVSVTESAFDLSSAITSFTSPRDLPDMEDIGDKIYVDSFLTGLANGMAVSNNVTSTYLKYVSELDKKYYSAIQYGYGVSLTDNLFTTVNTGRTEAERATQYMSLSRLKEFYIAELRATSGSEDGTDYSRLIPYADYFGNIVSKMPGSSDLSDPEFGKYVQSQYNVVAGKFPQKSNEAVLVIGENNQVTDLTLAQLGLLDEPNFLSLFNMGKNADETKKQEFIYIDYADLLGKEYVLYFNNEVYEKNLDYNPMAPAPDTYQFTYSGERASLDVNEQQGIALDVVGILQLKDGLTYGCLTSGLNITEAVVMEYIHKNMESQIVQYMKSTKSPAGPFYFSVPAKHLEEYYEAYSGAETGNREVMIAFDDNALRHVGGLDTVNSFQLYATDFDGKEQMLDYLDAWNIMCENGETYDGVKLTTADKITYTDRVGLLMGMMQTMLDVITYVLVAFTAISLVVSSVMIGIITYVSVVERVKEIGVLRSLGARKQDIRNLFNAETFIIGLAAGLIGIVVTYLISIIVNVVIQSLTGIAGIAALSPLTAFIMVVVSVLLTLISGLIPAQAAAKKDPVIALRTE